MALAIMAITSAACSPGSGLLGGRETCWPESEGRLASIWRGTLRIDATGSRLELLEGDVMPLWPGELATRVDGDGVGHLVHGEDAVATSGQDVTLFGGGGSDGSLVVCGVEQIHG